MLTNKQLAYNRRCLSDQRTDYVESFERPDGYNGHTCVIHVCKDASDRYFAVWIVDSGLVGYYTIADSKHRYDIVRRNAIRFI